MTYAIAPRRRLTAALAAGLVQGALVLLVVRGLAAHYLESGRSEISETLVALPEREPDPPPPPPAHDASGEGAPSAAKAQARPREAPSAKVLVAPPQPIPTQAGGGNADSAGLARAGSGSGQGGRGDGTGSGNGGAGSGSGSASPPQRIAGSLSDRDYPRGAAARGAAGTVGISFVVGPDGRVSRCAVIGSSGDGELDRLTCALVERRFVYRPARDTAGQAVEATLRTSFTWGTYRH